MLTLTEDARTIVKTIAGQAADSDAGGLRISATESDSMDFALALVAAPEPQDEIVEQAGARVFLEEHAAATLADKVLDAQVDNTGAVSFAIGDPA